MAFALLNLATAYFFFFWRMDHRFTLMFNMLLATYPVLVSAQYLALRRWSERSSWLPWLAFLMPVGILAAVRYAPLGEMARLFGASIGTRLFGVSIGAELQSHPEFRLSSLFIGSSYLAFRTSHLALEVRNGVVPRPGFWEYLGFAFFVPTLSVGPISPYSQHRR
ncbi:MAG TPA: hypothetical protein VFR76_10810, partial [Verrucomicrobiae bacterium]|nr:hypothetical protein [Verrucomicrobiae bacterium]